MSLKAVLFDMDGVIVDTEPLHRKAYFKMFSEVGVNVSEQMYSSFAGASTRNVCTTLIENFDLRETSEELIDIKRNFFKDAFANDPDFGLLPGVKELIENYYREGIKLILASSASDTTIDMVFERFSLAPYFMGRISGASLKESKPHPEIFLIAARMAEEPVENCMVIEDSTNGILAAHRAGIFCAAYRSEHTHNQDYTHADIVVSDYRELVPEKVSQYFF